MSNTPTSPTTTTTDPRTDFLQHFATTYRNDDAPGPDGDSVLAHFNPTADVVLLPYSRLGGSDPGSPELRGLFEEYFSWSRRAGTDDDVGSRSLLTPCQTFPDWPIPNTCVRLSGRRGIWSQKMISPPLPSPPSFLPFRRLYAADLVWLFFHERMGVFKIAGALLDDYVTRGKYPIRPSGVTGTVIEAMVREVKTGLSSTVRERDASYRRCLGWTSDVGAKLKNEAPNNSAFSTLFHRLLKAALDYYRDRRLAQAINLTTGSGSSTATVREVADTINLLRKSMDPFRYGRNHTHALSGIVWVEATLILLHSLVGDLGIPTAYNRPYEYFPAIFDMMVGGGATKDASNRYTVHRDCANAARNILLDVQGFDYDAAGHSFVTLVKAWLENIEVEATFESYRTAYRALTGIDVGASGGAVIEQAA
jgi:hypothetical protein